METNTTHYFYSYLFGMSLSIYDQKLNARTMPLIRTTKISDRKKVLISITKHESKKTKDSVNHTKQE